MTVDQITRISRILYQLQTSVALAKRGLRNKGEDETEAMQLAALMTAVEDAKNLVSIAGPFAEFAKHCLNENIVVNEEQPVI